MYAPPIMKLIDMFAKMPGVGRKSAVRLCFHVMSLPEKECEEFVRAIMDVKEKITLCETCLNFTDTQPCKICADTRRDNKVICVVESPKDVTAMEKPH